MDTAQIFSPVFCHEKRTHFRKSGNAETKQIDFSCDVFFASSDILISGHKYMCDKCGRIIKISIAFQNKEVNVSSHLRKIYCQNVYNFV